MFKKFTLTTLLICTIFSAFAQKQELVTKDQFKKLQQISTRFRATSEENRAKAFELAKKNHWVTFQVKKDGTVISLQGVDDLGFPIYLTTYNNTTAAATTKTNSMYAGGSLGIALNGSSDNLTGKVGIWDGGSILASHQEFTGGRIVQKDSPSSSSEHATHVAGTMIASGVYPVARGMAWGLKKLSAYDFNSDAAEMTSEASNGMLISNHSYGFIAGWNYNTNTNPARWEWYGLPSALEDYKFGFYDNSARDWDIICYNAPYYLPVKSAGNNRTENGPPVGSDYYGFSSDNSSTLIDKGPRPSGISDNNSYDIISTTATAKNILTVGATYGLPFGPTDVTSIQIAPFSSWGPTDDGRIKPDIVADGVALTSASNTANDAYATLSGTSMASPNVSGSLVLLQEYYSKLHSGNFMRSATLKGLVIETADEAGTTDGPDYIFGWGLLDIERAAQLIKNDGTSSLIAERSLAQGEVYNLQVVASGIGPLKVTICWTDPEGTPAVSGTLNDRTPKLVNDLDLRLIQGGNTLLPWKLSPTNPSAAAIKADNTVDNVEQIAVPNAVPGQIYTIRVSHKGTLIKGPQNYSILASGIGGTVYCTSGASSTADSRIDEFQLNTIINTAPNTCRSYSDFTNITTNLEIGKTYPFNLNLGTCGVDANKIAKIYIDWNSDGDFNDNGETVATSPVIGNSSTFNGNITIPINVTPGNATLLRIVMAETSDPNTVTPCGTYSKGETQDYKINFVKSTSDAGVIAINNLNNNTCPTLNQKVSVRLKNFGSATITGIPVTVTISNNSTVIKTLTDTYTGNLAANNEIDFELNGAFSTQAGQTYSVNATTNFPNDVITSNNSSDSTFKVSTPLAPTNLSASACNNAAGFFQLNGQADGTLYWYNSSSAQTPIAVGPNPFATNNPDANNNFYAGVNDFKGYFGPTTKSVYTGGTYSGNFGPKPIITVAAPMTLDSALLYTSKAGKLTFTVETSSGKILSSVTINVDRSKTTVDALDSNSQIIDDPNDSGKMYALGLAFPTAGTYRIGIAYNGATIFRSNSGVSNIPITLGNNLIKLNGAYFDNGSGTPTTITTSYYYFYNMHFSALGCTDFSRTAVPVTKPVITQTGTTLNSSFSSMNQWYLNNVKIDGATNKSYSPTQGGTYRVDVQSSTGCVSSSDDFNYVLSAIKPADPAEIGLKAYPVPNNGLLNLSFETNQKTSLKISLLNVVGQEVYQQSKANFSGKYSDVLNLRNFNDGIYILNIKLGTKTYSQKITLNK